MITQIIDMLIPEQCVLCNQLGSACCKKCQEKMFCDLPQTCYRCNKLSPQGRTCPACSGSSGVYSVGKLLPYSDDARLLIRSMKFDLRRSLCGVFGAEMVQKLGIPPVDVVTYIPTAPRRVRERGFDHARIIARSAAKQGNLPFKRLLERTSSIRQVGAGRALRLRQMNNVFEVADPQHVKGKQILLVDDVVTTGATIESAAAVLRSAGARRVYVYAISLHYS